MRYLQIDQLRTNLSLCKTVEQWLGVFHHEDYAVIKLISIEYEKDDTYVVNYFEIFDEGSEHFMDVYEFSAVDPDNADRISKTFRTYEEALEFSIEKYGCRIDKFVNQGVVQSEYRDYLESKKLS